MQAHQAEEDGLADSALTLQVHMGLAWTVGCAAFGLIVVRNSVECRIARQYLCQASVFMCGVSILALATVRGDRQGYVLFAWVYGVFCGGYHYSLKMYTYERVRARNFARTWGFVQCSQAIPIALGVPIAGGCLRNVCGRVAFSTLYRYRFVLRARVVSREVLKKNPEYFDGFVREKKHFFVSVTFKNVQMYKHRRV